MGSRGLEVGERRYSKEMLQKSWYSEFRFQHCDSTFSSDDDPFADLDDEQVDREENEELSELIFNVQTENACSVHNLIHSEDHIPTCQEFADETWEKEFFSEFGPTTKSLTEEELDSDSEDFRVMERVKRVLLN